MSTRKAPAKKIGAVKVLMRKPSAAAAEQQQQQQQQQQAEQDTPEQRERLRLQREREEMLLRQEQRQQCFIVPSVPPRMAMTASCSTEPAGLDAAFLSVTLDQVLDAAGIGAVHHPESRARLLASALLGCADRITLSLRHRHGAPQALDELLDEVVDLLLESEVVHTMDAMLLELCKKVVDLDPALRSRMPSREAAQQLENAPLSICLDGNALSAAATWRHVVCRRCVDALTPLLEELDGLVTAFVADAASSAATADVAEKTAACFAAIEPLMRQFRRIAGCWRHIVRDLKHVVAEAARTLTTTRLSAADALIYHVNILAGDAAREEAHLFFTAQCAHEQLKKFLAAAASAAAGRKPVADADASEKSLARSRRKMQRPDVAGVEPAPATPATPTVSTSSPTSPVVSERRQGKAELKAGVSSAKGRGRGGGGAPLAIPVPASQQQRNALSNPSTPISPASAVDAEYRRSNIELLSPVEQLARQQQRPSMLNVQMFKPKKKTRAAGQSDAFPATAGAIDDDGGVVEHDADDVDDDDLSRASSEDGYIASAPSAPPAAAAAAVSNDRKELFDSVLSRLSPAGLDMLVGVKIVEIPLRPASSPTTASSAAAAASTPTVPFGEAIRKYRTAALVDCPYRGQGYERLASLFRDIPQAFEEQYPQRCSPHLLVAYLFLRAASASVDPIDGAAARALRELRRGARDVRRAVGGRSSRSILDRARHRVVSVEEATVAVTSPVLQLLCGGTADRGDEQQQQQQQPQTLVEMVRAWSADIEQCGRLMLKQHTATQAAADATKRPPINTDSALFFLRLAQIVVISIGIHRQQVAAAEHTTDLCRLAAPLALADALCAIAEAEENVAATTSLPTAVAFLLDASVAEAKQALLLQHGTSSAITAHQAPKPQPLLGAANPVDCDDDDGDEVIFGQSQPALVQQQQQHREPPLVEQEAGSDARSYLNSLLSSLRAKLLHLRHRCDAYAASALRAERHDGFVELHGGDAAILTCDDVEMYGLPRDLSLLLRRRSPWYSASSAVDEDANPNDDGDKWRPAVLRCATKITPAEHSAILAVGTRTPPHRHDATQRQYATTDQTLALRASRLADAMQRAAM